MIAFLFINWMIERNLSIFHRSELEPVRTGPVEMAEPAGFHRFKEFFWFKNLPVVPLRVESKNKFQNFLDKQLFIMKYAKSKFKFFYKNNGVVSKAISLFSFVCLFLISLIGFNFDS
jgi:hypothetical protein